MDKTIQLGRYLFAISMVFFGLEQFILSDFVPGLIPVPSWIPGRLFCAYLIGLILLAAGVSLITNQKARLTATLLGLLWIFCVVLLHIPKLIANPRLGSVWAPALEALAFGGGALALAGTFSIERTSTGGWDRAVAKIIPWGTIVFGITLPLFGIQHFLYIAYVAGVVPAWIPGKEFWGYFTGVAHICAGLSIVTNIKGRLAATLLGLMFGLWVLLLHIPRALVNLQSRNEWTSAIVALTMCGASLLVAGSLARKDQLKRPNEGRIESATDQQQMIGAD